MQVIKRGDKDRPAPSYEAHCFGCGSIISFTATEAEQVISLSADPVLSVACPVCNHKIIARISG